ncbi:hypothetical protein FHS82_001796 [Pseudochelatococcus lubricantis]|uniref:Uncharacterized protein n=1 Tax=Pseudochelatococcus lubricantis TaxID=1538102 RepID=A0ABX0V196_9HYPH|nr:hypothetical protein [Pseudochelatococcus lubricantis]NIJ57960.1 hypothetical protein [Pseudochelatococcus lubricantis]
MTSLTSHSEPEQQNSVSSFGLRWAALRGMLDSPLINADDQRSLRDELLRELKSIERAVGGLAARNEFEVAAKIEIIRQSISDTVGKDNVWLIDLLDSIGQDVNLLSKRYRAGTPSAPTSGPAARPAPGA